LQTEGFVVLIVLHPSRKVDQTVILGAFSFSATEKWLGRPAAGQIDRNREDGVSGARRGAKGKWVGPLCCPKLVIVN
jgi:hypothetical protein